MQHYIKAIQLLDYLCNNSTIDGIDFWGPKLILSPTRKNEMKVTAPIAITIEGSITLQNQNGTFTSTQSNEEQKLNLLSSLRRKEITEVKLTKATLDIELKFNDAILIIHGDNGPYESWKVDTYIGMDYIGVVACPGSELSVFTPKEETMKETSCYALIYFHSEKVVDVEEYAKLLSIDLKSSYSKGDPWTHSSGKVTQRKWSSIRLDSGESMQFDGTETFAKFFKLLKSKQREILYLKEKYNMKLAVHFVLSIYSNDMPYFKLTTDQMAFLQAVEANVEVFLYDYTKL